MASITLDDLDDGLVTRLRERAEAGGRSVEEEAAAILGEALPVRSETTGAEFWRSIREKFDPDDGVDLELPTRDAIWFAPATPPDGQDDEPPAGGPRRTGKHLVDAFHEAFAPFGGVELDLPSRNWTLDPPKFRD